MTAPLPPFHWPLNFVRIPDEPWTRQPIEMLALKYDTVEHHGWYRNLDSTVEEVGAYLRDGMMLVDYSGGTGILTERLLGKGRFGVAIVESSPKFLRLALEKFRNDERVAFRLIRYLRELKRLQYVDEVMSLGADALVSTNAIHLYYGLPETLDSWQRILRPGAYVFVQSGNIRNPAAKPGEWIIDETVEAIHDRAVAIVHRDPRFRTYRPVLGDSHKMEAYTAWRRKIFLPVRPLDHYLAAFQQAGFEILRVRGETIVASVREWYDFLSVYHDGVLGWVGGVEKIDGRLPTEEDVRHRLELIRLAMAELFLGDSFDCCWTYLTCRVPD